MKVTDWLTKKNAEQLTEGTQSRPIITASVNIDTANTRRQAISGICQNCQIMTTATPDLAITAPYSRT
jgi:hypothetical protein